MDIPGSSLCNGGSLHFDGISMEPGTPGHVEEEEAEAAEEEERRQQELQNVLKDAFDDLIEDDDDGDATLNHTSEPSFHPEKYPTSTPFIPGRDRSLYDELGDQYNLPRMSDPGGVYRPDLDGYHPDPGGYRPDPDGYRPDPDGYRPDPGEYRPDTDGYHPDLGEYHPNPEPGGYQLDSDGGYEPDPDSASHDFMPLRPEETNNDVTEMVDTPRQHLDTTGTDTSAAHYQHCYASPRNELAAPADADDEPDADVSSGNMIEMGLKAHETEWAGGRPERADVLDPGKYVVSKQKDYILARTSRDQLETLYEARGHEVGRLRAELERLRAETAAELRAARHQAALAAADSQGLQASLQQARQLLVEKEEHITQLSGEIESLKIQLKVSEEARKEQTSRLQAAEVTVSSLQTQLSELQRSDTLARNTQLHQQLVDGMKKRHEEEMAARRQQLDQLQAQLDSQTELASRLKTQLAQAEQARHQLAADKGDVINQLTAGLEAAQARCRQLMQGDPAQLRQQLAAEEARRQQTEQQLSSAQEQLASLQRDLDACESVLRLGSKEDAPTEETQLAMLAAPQSTPVSTRPSGGGEPAPFSLRRELMRSLENTRARREEVARLRAELEDARQQLRQADGRQAEMQAQLAALREQVKQTPPAGQAEQTAEKVAELQQQVAAEQKQRKLVEDQLRKIRHEGEKVHKTAEELRRHLAEQVEEADRARLQAVEEVRQACLQLHDDMINKLRTEKVEEYETELDNMRTEVTHAQQELHDVKELYVKVCQEKDQLEQDIEAERKAATRERELAVKSALNQHYDLWYADWKKSQQAAITEAVEAERRRQRAEVGSAATQTSTSSESRCVQTSPEPVPPPAHTRDQAVQASDEAAAQQLDKLKKRLKRACLDKKKLESDIQELQEHIKLAACAYEEKIKKEKLEAERKLREAKRRSANAADNEIVKSLRLELEERDTRLKSLTQQTCREKEELVATYESRLRQALEEDRRLAAVVVTERRSQLTADQLSAECARLRAEADRAAADHQRQLKEREDEYQRGLASYRQLIENNVAELTKAEAELRREAAASCELLREENTRLTAESARLAESYDALVEQRRADRENYEQQVRQLTSESDGGEQLRGRLAELEARLQQAEAEASQLRERLRAGKEKLHNYHGYVKERERHYDGEFRRLEAEYRVAVGKMKEKVMLAMEGAARRPAADRRSAAAQTEVTGDDLVRALRDMSGFQRTVSQLRQELTHVLERCPQPAAGGVEPARPGQPADPEPSTYRSHVQDPRRPASAAARLGAPLSVLDRPLSGPLSSLSRPDSGPLSSLGRPESGPLSGRGVSPLLATGDNPLASLERIRRDLNYIFPREPATAAARPEPEPAGPRLSAGEELLARLARLPLTPPSRDAGGGLK